MRRRLEERGGGEEGEEKVGEGGGERCTVRRRVEQSQWRRME